MVELSHLVRNIRFLIRVYPCSSAVDRPFLISVISANQW